jgi:glycosyltransferase involved in cell wall biosynthesis
MLTQKINKLSIGIIAPPWFPLPPNRYGGIEKIVSILADGLAARGHRVTLFASGDSFSQATLSHVLAKAPSKKINNGTYLEAIHSLAAYAKARHFNIIHDHDGIVSRSLGAIINQLLKIPVVATLHGPVTPPIKNFFKVTGSSIFLITLTDFQRNQLQGLNYLATIPNAIEISNFPFTTRKEDFLLFVGRMNPEKGAGIAARIARMVNRRLIMIGKLNEPEEKIYFEKCVRPYLNKNVIFIGEVDQKTKLDLYAKASCTLFPIQWDEPFGLVMIESMACGTPVIAFRRGSVPEIIKHGETGFIVESVPEMIKAIKKIERINNKVCRKYVAEKFNVTSFLDKHEEAYLKAIELASRNKTGAFS